MIIFNDILAFALEIICIVIYARFGYSLFETVWIKIVLAIFLSFMAIIVWGLYFAPQASARLEMPFLLIGKLIIMFLAVFMLFYMKERLQATILAIVLVVHFILGILMKNV